MTEVNQVHGAARRAFHLPPAMLWARVDNPLTLGTPDICYCLLGVTGWCEEKILTRSGKAPKHLTIEQVQWGEEWSRAGGLWHLLARREKEWLLFDACGARALLEGIGEPLLRKTGKFPRREMLEILAPVGRRISWTGR